MTNPLFQAQANLHDGNLTWCCDPTITHFRPLTMYTHWPDDSPAIKYVAKLETMDEDLQKIGKLLFNQSFASDKRARVGGDPKRRFLCPAPTGCIVTDLNKLLAVFLSKKYHSQHRRLATLNQLPIAHTPETLQIVNDLYYRDFQLLNYSMLPGNAIAEFSAKKKKVG